MNETFGLGDKTGNDKDKTTLRMVPKTKKILALKLFAEVTFYWQRKTTIQDTIGHLKSINWKVQKTVAHTHTHVYENLSFIPSLSISSKSQLIQMTKVLIKNDQTVKVDAFIYANHFSTMLIL